MGSSEESGAGLLTVRRGTVSYEVLLRPGALMIGRDARLGLCLNDASVSRRHAVLVATGNTVEVHDLGGRNGVVLNGAALPARGRALLRAGDRLRIGATELAYELASAEPEAPADPPPPAPVAAPPAAGSLVVLSALVLAIVSVLASLLVALAALRQPQPPAQAAMEAGPSSGFAPQAQVQVADVAPPATAASSAAPVAPASPAPPREELAAAPPPRGEPAPVSSQAPPPPEPPAQPAAPTPAQGPLPAERAALEAVCLRLEGREPSPAELDALLATGPPARVEWLLAREALYARAWTLELEHQGLAGPFALAGSPWSEVPAQLRAGADPLEALGRVVSSSTWARRHLGAGPTARAVLELLLASPDRPAAASPEWWAAQRACEGEEAELLGGKARSARELLGLALAHPDARRALQGRLAARALGRVPAAGELERLAGEIEREGHWFRPLVRLACEGAVTR